MPPLSTSLASLRPYLELIRLPAVFTAPADVLLGVALAGVFGGVARAISIRDVVLLVAASAAIYCAGMAANDIFDAAIDARERPERPIPSGRVPLWCAWTLVIGFQVAGIALAVSVGPLAAAAVAATIAMTFAYNGVLKNVFLAPLTMGACRYGNALIGLSIAGWPADPIALCIPLGGLAYVTALTSLSRYEVDGAPASRVRPIAASMLGLAVAAGIWAPAGVLPEQWGALAVILPVVWLAKPLARTWQNPDARTVRGGVMAGIFGIALIDAAVAVQAGGFWQAAAIVGLLVPGKWVGRWFYST